MRVSSLSIRLQRALALAGGAAATLALVLSGLPATAEPCWNGCGEPTVLARSATSASQASVSQTKRNSRQYRRDRAREAARDRSKIRRATRRTYYGRDHQPGGYCIYDAKGKVILRPEGVVCEGDGDAYMQSSGDAPAARGPRATGCVSGSCKTGHGTYVWPNGTQYAGDWKEGRQHGQGTLLLPDGASYVGQWKLGKKHGQGTGTYADGRVQSGAWDSDRFVGRARAHKPVRIRWPDLSKAPPRTPGGGKNDAAVVIGVTRYAHVAEIPGASENAADWYNYLVKMRGVPLERVSLLIDEDATVEEMRWAAGDAANRVRKGGTLWFVFVGHGAPAKSGKDGLLIGFDAQQKARSIEARSLPRSELLALLQDSKAEHVRVLLDACFSGKSSSGEQLVAGLQPLVVANLQGEADPRTTVLTAAGSNEYAGPLPGAARPAFSYLALGGLRGWADSNRDGRITAGEVHGYVAGAMRALVRDRRQRPTLTGDRDARLVKSSKEKGPDIAKLVLDSARR